MPMPDKCCKLANHPCDKVTCASSQVTPSPMVIVSVMLSHGWWIKSLNALELLPSSFSSTSGKRQELIHCNFEITKFIQTPNHMTLVEISTSHVVSTLPPYILRTCMVSYLHHPVIAGFWWISQIHSLFHFEERFLEEERLYQDTRTETGCWKSGC